MQGSVCAHGSIVYRKILISSPAEIPKKEDPRHPSDVTWMGKPSRDGHTQTEWELPGAQNGDSQGQKMGSPNPIQLTRLTWGCSMEIHPHRSELRWDRSALRGPG